MSVVSRHREMVRIPGGTFRMDPTGFYPEEGPVREVAVDSLLVDRHPVTVREFRRFVDQTGYRTVAERPLDPRDYPDADPALLVPGSLVFQPTPGPVPLNDPYAWWSYVPDASWRSPEGPSSDVARRARHPVTQVTFERCRGVRRLGRQGAADRGRVGIRGARRTRRCCLRLGRRDARQRQAACQLLAG